LVIYIAGPYRAKTEWDVLRNVRRAEESALELWRKGWAVICPHKNTHGFNGYLPDQTWIDGDLEIIKRCDAICMLAGWEQSEGAQMEYGLAVELKMPIYFGAHNVPDGKL
jgi:hypothetical protein